MYGFQNRLSTDRTQQGRDEGASREVGGWGLSWLGGSFLGSLDVERRGVTWDAGQGPSPQPLSRKVAFSVLHAV